MDHVERNLDRPLTLEELAGVACFSPFHFHRLFTALTGETLHQFILRVRVERAANQLRQNPGKSITAIALDCGFGSSAAFARAFRAAFGTTASGWRAGSSKIRQSKGKAGQESAGPARYDPPVGVMVTPDESDGREKMPSRTLPVKEAQSVRIETIDAMPVAYVRHVGPYAGDAKLFERLFGTLCQWVGARGLFGPTTKLLTIYHDNPEVTSPDKLRISVCATVPAGTRAEGDVGTMTVDGGKYAVAKYELDPSEYGAAWNWLMGVWLPSSGFQPDDRHCFELTLNNPKEHPAGKHIVEIWEPVRPL
jgi:AraC family transcriptional regulator